MSNKLIEYGVLIDLAILIALCYDVYVNYHIWKLMEGNGGKH